MLHVSRTVLLECLVSLFTVSAAYSGVAGLIQNQELLVFDESFRRDFGGEERNQGAIEGESYSEILFISQAIE